MTSDSLPASVSKFATARTNTVARRAGGERGGDRGAPDARVLAAAEEHDDRDRRGELQADDRERPEPGHARGDVEQRVGAGDDEDPDHDRVERDLRARSPRIGAPRRDVRPSADGSRRARPSAKR